MDRAEREQEALRLVRELSKEYNWATWVITQDDLVDEIQRWSLEPCDTDVAREIAEQVSDTKTWREGVSEAMMVEGFDCMREAIKYCMEQE